MLVVLGPMLEESGELTTLLFSSAKLGVLIFQIISYLKCTPTQGALLNNIYTVSSLDPSSMGTCTTSDKALRVRSGYMTLSL